MIIKGYLISQYLVCGCGPRRGCQAARKMFACFDKDPWTLYWHLHTKFSETMKLPNWREFHQRRKWGNTLEATVAGMKKANKERRGGPQCPT